MDSHSIAFLVAILGFLGALVGASIPAIINWIISARERIDKFRFVALDKRLAVHQEAFKIWRELIFSLSKQEKRDEIVLKGQDWWDENCLYLDAKSRDSFHSALIYAWQLDDSVKSKERREIFDKINATGRHLIEGINLPFRGEIESKIHDSK